MNGDGAAVRLRREPARGLSPSGRILLSVLARLRFGDLTLRMSNGETYSVQGAEPGPSARVTVRDRGVSRRIITRGALGLAETYMDGAWDTPDLAAVLELGALNTPLLGRLANLPSPAAPLRRLAHLANVNTPRGSKKNILAHYDLGNDFYQLWLDPSMTYSCGLFDSDGCSLKTAQVRKWNRLLAIVDPKPGERLLEIGCGWGGFAVHAAKSRGCHVTGITISDRQYEYARALAQSEGVGDLVEIVKQDYRHTEGTFDHVVSIEMFEAVGERYWPTFFETLRDRLRPGGTAALQVITVCDESFAQYKKHPDFTQLYIFPGGMLPSLSAFEMAARDSDLPPVEMSLFGRHYVKTLEEWSARFDLMIPQIRSLGFDERFERMWRFYLAYCRAGFATGNIDVMQVALTRT